MDLNSLVVSQVDFDQLHALSAQLWDWLLFTSFKFNNISLCFFSWPRKYPPFWPQTLFNQEFCHFCQYWDHMILPHEEVLRLSRVRTSPLLNYLSLSSQLYWARKISSLMILFCYWQTMSIENTRNWILISTKDGCQSPAEISNVQQRGKFSLDILSSENKLSKRSGTEITSWRAFQKCI